MICFCRNKVGFEIPNKLPCFGCSILAWARKDKRYVLNGTEKNLVVFVVSNGTVLKCSLECEEKARWWRICGLCFVLNLLVNHHLSWWAILHHASITLRSFISILCSWSCSSSPWFTSHIPNLLVFLPGFKASPLCS